MSKPVAYRFKSPLSEEGQWEYGKEPPVGSRWEIEGLYRVQVNVPRTSLEKAAKEMLQSVDGMLRNGEWYQAQERADVLRAALAQPDPAEVRQGWEYMREKGLLQAPVAWMYEWGDQKLVGFLNLDELESARTPLYTAPPPRKPLTEEIEKIINDNSDGDGICCADDLLAAIRAHGIGSHDA